MQYGPALFPKSGAGPSGMQDLSKERKTMQAARDEMKRRIETLERHAEHCSGERAQLLEQAAELESQIESDKNLATQYREVLRRLNVTVTYQTYDEVVANGQGRPDAL